MASKSKKISTSWAEGRSFFGKRYVFFSSLDKSSFFYENVKAHFKKTKDTLRPKPNDSDSQSSITYIENYLNMIRQLAENEKSAEIQFLKENQKDNSPLSKILSGFETGKVDYIQFIKLINETLKDSNIFKKNLETQINNIKAIQERIESQEKSQPGSKEKLNKEYLDSYKLYSNQIQQLLKEKLEKMEHEYKTTQSQFIADKINSLISELANNEEFINLIITELDTLLTRQASSNEIITAIQNLAVQTISKAMKIHSEALFNFSNEKYKQIIDGIMSETIGDLNKNLSSIMQKTYSKVFSSEKKDIARIETIALKDGDGIAKILQENEGRLNSELFKIFDKDTQEKLNKLYENLNNKMGRELSKARRDLTAAVKKAIQSEAQKQTNQEINVIINDANIREQALLSLNSIRKNKSASASLNDLVSSQLKISRISAPSVGEIVASPDFLNELNKKITSNIPGNVIQLKNDVSFTVNFNDDINVLIEKLYTNGNSSHIKILKEYKKMIDDAAKNFLEEYNNNAKGKTDVEAARNAYINQMKKIADAQIELITSSSISIADLQKYLNNFLLGSISVKEYSYYNNDLGYHAGSLGGGGKATEVIPNLLKMMEIGGLTPMDVELVIEAVLNCNEGLMGAGMEEDIKNYLIAGAAMMLFDDGFANAEKFLEYMKKTLFMHDAPKVVHLLHLNTTYIPQSFILFNIYDNLLEVYSDIITFHDSTKNGEIGKTKVRNKLYINNNITEENLTIPEGSSAERWNYVSNKAQEEVTIQYLFMAGMLDILEEIEKAFEQK